ncbi:hypothetical protein ACFX1X_027949 [Malus domestica]
MWSFRNQRGISSRISKAGLFVQKSKRQQGHRFKDRKGTTFGISKRPAFQDLSPSFTRNLNFAESTGNFVKRFLTKSKTSESYCFNYPTVIDKSKGIVPLLAVEKFLYMSTFVVHSKADLPKCPIVSHLREYTLSRAS